MIVRQLRIAVITSAVLVARPAALPLCAATFEFACDRPDGVYSLGEKTTITVKVFETNKVPLASGSVKWRLNNFGDATISEGTFDASKGVNTFSVSGTMNEPGFMRLDVTELDGQGNPGKTQFFGVAYDPYRIRPGAECPADFNDFWAAAVKKYDEIVTAPIKMARIDDYPSKERHRLPADGRIQRFQRDAVKGQGDTHRSWTGTSCVQGVRVQT